MGVRYKLTPNHDRFIPVMTPTQKEWSRYNIATEQRSEDLSPRKEAYKDEVARSLFPDEPIKTKILTFKEKAPIPQV